MTVQIEGNDNHHIAGRDLYNESHQYFYVEHCLNVECRVPLVKNEIDYCYACRSKKEAMEVIGKAICALFFFALMYYENMDFAEYLGFSNQADTVASILLSVECAILVWIGFKLR